MTFMEKRKLLTGAVFASLYASTAWAQSGAADKCMTLSTDAERLDCMRTALDEAERKLREAGVQPEAAAETQLAAPERAAPGPRETGLAALGSEQVAVREGKSAGGDDAERRYHANVVRFRERVPGQMVFELDNGQVWKQTSADSQRLRLREGEALAVELWSTWSGGYRMLLPDRRQTVRVERVR